MKIKMDKTVFKALLEDTPVRFSYEETYSRLLSMQAFQTDHPWLAKQQARIIEELRAKLLLNKEVN